ADGESEDEEDFQKIHGDRISAIGGIAQERVSGDSIPLTSRIHPTAPPQLGPSDLRLSDCLSLLTSDHRSLITRHSRAAGRTPLRGNFQPRWHFTKNPETSPPCPLPFRGPPASRSASTAS